MPRKTNRVRPAAVEEPCRFNEAAARCRGKPSMAVLSGAARAERFNEAAARCRGKPRSVAEDLGSAAHASMRPRPDAAENLPGRRIDPGSVRALQ